MNTTTIHIKTDIKTRDNAKKVAKDYGFSLTALVNVVLKQIARTKHLTLNLDEEPTQYMIESLKKSIEKGLNHRFPAHPHCCSRKKSVIEPELAAA